MNGHRADKQRFQCSFSRCRKLYSNCYRRCCWRVLLLTSILSTGTAPGPAGKYQWPCRSLPQYNWYCLQHRTCCRGYVLSMGSPNGVTGISSSKQHHTVSFEVQILSEGFICVIPQNPCGNGSSACLNVPVLNVKPGVPGTIIRAFPSCGPATYTYSIPTVVNATNYVWSFGSESIISGQGTNSIRVFIPSGMGQEQFLFMHKTVSVTVPHVLHITGVPTHSNALVGPGLVCPNSTNVAYSMGQVNGTGSYIWTISGNATIAKQQRAKLHCKLCVQLDKWNTLRDDRQCLRKFHAYLYYSICSRAKPGSITGPGNNLCGQSNVTYSIAAVAGATSYEWTLPGGKWLRSHR